MNKTTKVMIIMFINIIIIGIGLVVTGFIMDLNSQELVDSFDVSTQYNEEAPYIITDEFLELKTSLTNRNVIYKYDVTYNNEVHYYNSPNDIINIYFEDGTIKIIQETKNEWYSFTFFYSTPEVLDIIIYSNKIISLDINTTIGETIIVGQLDNLKINSAVGNISLVDVKSTNIHISSNVGKITANNIMADKIKIETHTGSINTVIAEASEVVFKTSIGSINATILIIIDELSYDIKTDIGNIRLNNIRQNRHLIETKHGTCFIEARTNTGNINLLTI